MTFDVQKINGLWYAVFANGHKTEGFTNANVARTAGNAYVQEQLIKAGK